MIQCNLAARLCLRIGLAIAILLTATASLHAEQFGDLDVRVLPDPTVSSSHGYVEHRVSITNRSKTDAHHVEMWLGGDHHRPGHHLRRLSRQVLVPAATTVEVSLLQPAVGLYSNELQLLIDRRKRETLHGIHLGGHPRERHYGAAPVIVLSRGVSGGTRDMLRQAIEKATTPAGASHWGGTPPVGDLLVRVEKDVAQWSTNWLAYTALDGIVLTPREMQAMPAAVADAIWSWTQAGGTLVVLGQVQLPQAWRQWSGEPPVDPRHRIHNIGFGQCWQVEPDAFSQWNDVQWAALYDQIQTGGQPWNGHHYNIESANAVFPVVENLAIPVRTMLGVMVAFAVLVGPINLLVLGKIKRRIWLLWTTPTAALLLSGAVVATAVIAEGGDVHARTEVVTVLDQIDRRASTIGWIAFYSPFTPRGGAMFDTNTELNLLVERNHWNGEGRASDLDWTQGQHLAGGWIAARIPSHFQIRKSEMRRERLAISRDDDGNIHVVNGLGAAIDHLSVADEHGIVHEVKNVQPGARATLRSTNEKVVAHADVLSTEIYRRDWPRLLEVSRRPPSYLLRPNTYFAQLDAAPFVEPGIQATHRRDASIVYGLFAFEEAADAN